MPRSLLFTRLKQITLEQLNDPKYKPTSLKTILFSIAPVVSGRPSPESVVDYIFLPRNWSVAHLKGVISYPRRTDGGFVRYDVTCDFTSKWREVVRYMLTTYPDYGIKVFEFSNLNIELIHKSREVKIKNKYGQLVTVTETVPFKHLDSIILVKPLLKLVPTDLLQFYLDDTLVFVPTGMFGDHILPRIQETVDAMKSELLRRKLLGQKDERTEKRVVEGN